MSVLSLCVEPNPILRATARPVDRATDNVSCLVHDMIETMYAHDGIGLAAPQVGRDIQVFVASPSQERGRESVVINPVMVAMQGRTAMTEGCLSLPHMWERVTRAARIHMRGQDVSGNPVDLHVDGLSAIVLQHEFDHLQGRLFIDRLSWWRRCRLWRRSRTVTCV